MNRTLVSREAGVLLSASRLPGLEHVLARVFED
jgi:hypothetical protein